MVTVEAATLAAHVLVGFVALFAGLGALATTKGASRHRLFGRAYVWAMAAVSGTALALFPMDPPPDRQFLALIAVFSFYFAFSGYRVLSRKRPGDDPVPVDWVAVGLFGLASAGLVATGALQYRSGSDFAPVLLVFGAIGAVFTIRDLWTFRRETEAGAWVSARRDHASAVATNASRLPSRNAVA